MAETGRRSTLKERLRAGLTARRAGNVAAAEQIFRQVLRQRPGQPDALNLLGVLLAETGRLDEAIGMLERAAAARPQSASISVNLAQALLAANRPAEAAEILMDPKTGTSDSGTRLLLVRALLADHQPEEAAKEARRALASCRNPGLLTALGDALVQSGDTAPALPYYEEAIAAAPDHGPTHNNLGTALEKLGRLDEAGQAYERAIACMPHHAGARINLGTVQLRTGDAEGAQSAFEAVLARDPFNQRAIAYLAIARQENGVQAPQDVGRALEPLIHERRLPCPDSFSGLTDFHAALAQELHAHPARRWDVSGTATTGGFDALRLFDHKAPALNSFERQLRAALDRHIAGLPHEEGHPFLGRRCRSYTLDAWAVFLKSGGYQFPHIHPSGWISGVYYVQVPPSAGERSGRRDGWIEFNRPDEGFDYSFEPAVIQKKPEPGLLLLFPSYVYHRTIPFESGTDRISIAFDVKPAP